MHVVTSVLSTLTARWHGLHEDPWRLNVLGALLVATCAYLFGLWLEGPSGQANPFDWVTYPTLIAVFLTFMVLLVTYRVSTATTVMTVIVVVYAQFVGKLIYLLHFSSRPDLIQAEFTETFFWLPVLFVLSPFIPGMKRGRAVAVLFFASFSAVSVGYIVPNWLAGRNFGVSYALIEMTLANVTLLVLTYSFIGFRESLVRTSERAETMERLAHQDSLTNLPNRLALEHTLARQIERCQEGTKVAVAFIDIDDFKMVNDTQGHAVGDKLLSTFAARLDRLKRDGDAAFRISGDEFVMLFSELPREVDALSIGERVRATLTEPFEVGGRLLNISASVGVALCPDDGLDPAKLLRHADTAMYTVKHRGKDGVAAYRAGSDELIEDRARLLGELRQAIRDGRLELHYQPIIDLWTNRPVKVEALLRWSSPTRGNVPPATFIALAEAHGLIAPLGLYALKSACRQLNTWAREGAEEVVVSVNVSAQQLQDPEFVPLVEALLVTTGVNPARLELELTESSVIHALDQVTQNLRALRRLGVAVALDDFGTGYSSLSYLETLDFDTIKIDHSFAQKLSQTRTNPQYSVAIIRAVLEIAEVLEVTVVAEGIETREQLDLFRGLGCRLVQGYYFSKPVPASEMTALLKTSWTQALVHEPERALN